jgi:hypothetical protein
VKHDQIPDYDPVESLTREVERFKATNQFSPMLVTGFYLQAACVLTELKQTRKENSKLAVRVKFLENQVSKLEIALKTIFDPH